jgi:imidazole glycerol-phosphate synthase subunit HisH
MIGIIDFGAGNLQSVANAFDQINVDAAVIDDPAWAADCDRLVLPGVGSFALAMEALAERGWTDALRRYAETGRPLLGICLGMQLLFERGEEHGETAGLGLIPGAVLPLRPSAAQKVPHVGWNSLIHLRQHPLFERVKPHVDFYFVHSFHCVPRDPGDVIARCEYGENFTAVVARASIAGMQFHPEKSQPAGLRILENFTEWDGGC